ncbi:MAG: S8 family serine peptidase [Shewanella xiamenensis]|jgi:subtilisin family serine protease|uniref:S8 family serine peptidase n=1 Tax=unclassified Shewanella TaxID=196818 RepID=UPI000B5163EA|nr:MULTISPECIES: S8 family serine peptidase [unclassified Shewanella]ASF14722.1 GlyGly-CTERM sorting domain-containing protein [Shewanella sp. FDAARGOS_354]MCD8560789.1 S8 family serine peptidase [Shewanella xiamenensis]QQK60484.1 S8 family serine peptidase [Shewanella sp. LC6]TPE56089.1 GlyGly-CTERM sorting domain-containing protein [Shewanella sp. LC2]
MKTKIALAVSMALLSSAANAQTVLSPTGETIQLDIPAELSNDSTRGRLTAVNNQDVKFIPEPEFAEGEHTYIVRLRDSAVANYQGEIPGFKATSPQHIQSTSQAKGTGKTGNVKLNAAAPEVKNYVSFLKVKQERFLTSASAAIGTPLEPLTTYQYALNGIAVRMTQAQAIKMAELPEVIYIERERIEQLETDVSQALIGSPKVWDGSATGTKAMGEGVVVAIIDSGINSDHASFADIGGDGYDHTNPLGQGIYIGDCKTDFASMCNDKLIGVRSYPEITDIYDDEKIFGATPPAKNGEDYGGHGSHVASTAAGNILLDVPYVDGEVGKLEGDGIATGLKFAQISGVAPHANIIAYQICRPGDAGDKYSGCPTVPILKAIDDAIKDGVDVINFSISGGGNPWNSATEQGFLAARNAGIFAAVAAGNTRPATATSAAITQSPYSTPKNAPWYTSVANSTHNREVVHELEFNGKTFEFTPGSGPVQTEVVKGLPVFAGSVDATNVEGCKVFPADAFKDKIAVIKRGTCDFATKVSGALTAGAKAVIVYNRDGEGNARFTMSALEKLNVPAVFIGNTDGVALIEAMAANPAVELTLTPTPQAISREADVLSAGSLIGPNATNDVIVPSVAAPGSDIYAAYSDQQFGHDKSGTNPADFTLMSGTSMASPHVAGAGALLKSLHKDWTPDNIRSALMLTATTAQAMKKADAKTVADPFDVGAGRIRVDLAAKAGLVMDESALNYEIANPLLNGDPRKLNVPSMADSRCVNTCTWTRTVTATQDGSWTAKGQAVTDKLALTVSPESFTLKKGASQTITVTADVTQVGADWGFGNLVLESANYPTATMPIAAKIGKRNLPNLVSIQATRNADEITLEGLKAVDFASVGAEVTGLKLSQIMESSVKQDSNNASYTDDLEDGVKVFKFDVNENALYFRTSISYTTSPDLDMYVLLDKNDGSKLARAGSSARDGSQESVLLNNPVKGTYYVIVQNYTASTATADDVFGLKQLTLYDTAEDNLTATLSGDTNDFDVKLTWKDALKVGDDGLAMLTFTTGDDKVAPVKLPVVFERVGDDVLSPLGNTLSGQLTPGVAKMMKTRIEANKTQVTRVYNLEAMLPEGHEVANISHDGKQDGNKITWTIEMPSGAEAKDISFELVPRKAGVDNELSLSNKVNNASSETLTQSYQFDVAEVAPVAKVEAPTAVQEGKPLFIDASKSSDANNDPLTYKWTQLGGASFNFDPAAAKLNLVAPSVNGAAQTVSFQLTVSDNHGNSDSSLVSVSITDTPPKKDDGGALGWLSLLLLPFAFGRRKLR